jgi:hypothetical protein
VAHVVSSGTARRIVPDCFLPCFFVCTDELLSITGLLALLAKAETMCLLALDEDLRAKREGDSGRCECREPVRLSDVKVSKKERVGEKGDTLTTALSLEDMAGAAYTMRTPK